MTNDVTKKVTFYQKKESAGRGKEYSERRWQTGANAGRVLHRETNFQMAKMLQSCRVSEIDDASEKKKRVKAPSGTGIWSDSAWPAIYLPFAHRKGNSRCTFNKSLLNHCRQFTFLIFKFNNFSYFIKRQKESLWDDFTSGCPHLPICAAQLFILLVSGKWNCFSTRLNIAVATSSRPAGRLEKQTSFS